MTKINGGTPIDSWHKSWQRSAVSYAEPLSRLYFLRVTNFNPYTSAVVSISGQKGIGKEVSPEANQSQNLPAKLLPLLHASKPIAPAVHNLRTHLDRSATFLFTSRILVVRDGRWHPPGGSLLRQSPQGTPVHSAVGDQTELLEPGKPVTCSRVRYLVGLERCLPRASVPAVITPHTAHPLGTQSHQPGPAAFVPRHFTNRRTASPPRKKPSHAARN